MVFRGISRQRWHGFPVAIRSGRGWFLVSQVILVGGFVHVAWMGGVLTGLLPIAW